MKLLFIFYDWPNYFGGPIVNARRLLPELKDRGHDIHCLIFYHSGQSPSADYLTTKGVTCHLQKLGRYTEKQIFWILKKISVIGPDIFVPNLSVAGWFAARWARESGIPTIACHRSDDQFHWAMVDEFVTGLEKWALSGLVCVSDDLRRKVERRKPKHTKICVIPSGVPVPEETSSQTGPLNLVYVGRLVQEQKRIYDLVDSLSTVLRNNENIKATLIGDGKERLSLQAHIDRLGMNRSIQILGTVPTEKIQAELVNYDVLVLLSDYEGTPGAVMDAMATGLVPVCLDIPGGVRELIQDELTGFLVKDRKQSFWDVISRLSAEPSLRLKIAANARERIVENYSIQLAADRWEAFGQELVGIKTKHSSIVIPKNLSLPPLRPGLDREDRRMGSLIDRALSTTVRLVKKPYIKRTL